MMLWMMVVLLLVAALALAQVFRSKHQVQLKKERIQRKVGIGGQVSSGFEKNNGCWWCRVGLILGTNNAKQRQQLSNQLLSAGFNESHHLGAYFFIKYAVMVGAFLLAFVLWVFYAVSPLLMVALPLLVMLLPERILIQLGHQRLDKINQQLPDFIDMTTICMNAGLSYLVSIKRVAGEMRNISPEICQEFDNLIDQIQIGVPRIDALQQFAVRNPTRDIENLVQVLIQNEKLGSSISEALNQFSRSMYEERQNLMEEKAAKTSAKMAIVILPFMLVPYVILLVGEKFVLLGRGF
ncbi:MAG: type II secretion system F family protein [Thiotrichales bacterium]|nr:type II secretion system F family protein [Thiotrichales bacterium]